MLQLLSSDNDIVEKVSHHVGHGLVELYIVTYGVIDVDVEEEDVDV